MTFKQRLTLAINKAARITVYCEEMRESLELKRISAKAQAYIENNPKPRAVFH